MEGIDLDAPTQPSRAPADNNGMKRRIDWKALAALVVAACNLPYPADVSVDAANPFAVDVANDHFYLRTNASISIGVTLARGATSGDVDITVAAPPTGVTFDPLTIPAGATAGTLVAHASSAATFGRSTLIVMASTGGSTTSDGLDLDVIGKFGELDTTFGTAGTTPIDTTSGNPTLLLAQGDKLVLVGTEGGGSATRAYATRLDAEGKIDTTFATGGIYTDTLQSIGIANGFGVFADSTSDGRILLAGAGFNGTDGDPFVVVLTPDGKVDVPARRIDTSAHNDAVTSVFVDKNHPSGTPDTTFLGGGDSASGDGMLMRLTSTFDIDTAFGGGRVLLPAPADILSIAHSANGVVVFLGGPNSNSIAHVDSSGVADAAFSAVLHDPHGAPYINGVGIGTDSGFLAWGEGNGMAATGVESVFAVWRCLPDGTADGQFGSGGLGGVYEALPVARTESIKTVIAVPDGSGLIAIGYDVGTASGSNDYNLDLVRLEAVGEPDTSVGPNGIVQDTSMNLRPEVAAAMNDHRFAVAAITGIGTSSPSLVVRRYFW